MITIVDSRIGNLGSLQRALELIGVESKVTSNPSEVAEARSIILPGVGAFGHAMNNLRACDLDRAIRSAVENGSWLLGICLGMQLLSNSSDEHGYHEGLALIPGTVTRLQEAPGFLRVPNIGWRTVRWADGSQMAPPWTDTPNYYFVHSFHMVPESERNSVGFMPFGTQDVTVAAREGRVLGVQFHPEKSQAAGVFLLARFNEMTLG